MVKRIMCVVLCTGATNSSGCGTVMNTAWFIPQEGGQRVYGGVRLDWSYIAEERAPSDSPKALAVADLPFSLIGDTLTLPYILALALTTDEHSGAARPTKTQLIHESETSGPPGKGIRRAKENNEPTKDVYERLNGNVGP
jgi:uncharacterized protein YceK